MNKEIKFESGDEVEYAYEGEDFRNGIVRFHCKTFKHNNFLCEFPNGIIFTCDRIRKLDPDKKYRDAAKGIIQDNETGLYSRTEVESMLIEALKKQM